MKKCKECEKNLDKRNKSGYCQKCWASVGQVSESNPSFVHGRVGKTFCLDCDKKIYVYSVRCRECDYKHRSERQRGFNNPIWKGGLPLCLECGKKLSHYKSKRCHSCANKLKSLKHGRCVDNRCIDCGDKIYSASTRCRTCSVMYRIGKGNPQYGKRGCLHHGWRGGKKPLIDSIRRSCEYAMWRKEVFKRDGFVCCDCGNKASGNLEAHHIVPMATLTKNFLSEYSQFSPTEDTTTLLKIALSYSKFWDINNGLTLCKDCHKKTRTYFCNQYDKVME